MKKILIISIPIFLLIIGLLSYIFFYKAPMSKANKKIDAYIIEKNDKNASYTTSKIAKDWKGGGFYKSVYFKDEKKISYQYYYDPALNAEKHILVDPHPYNQKEKPKHYYTK